MAKPEKSFFSYVTGSSLPREQAVDALVLLQQHLDFSKQKLNMAVIMTVNALGACYLIDRLVPAHDIEAWAAINLCLALLLVIDSMLKRGRPLPKKVSGKYLYRSEFLSIGFGLAWGSLPFFCGPETDTAMIMGGLMIAPMAAGMASFLTRVPRIVLRYGFSVFLASFVYSAYEQSVVGAAVCTMMVFFMLGLYLGARASYQAYRSDIHATLQAEESRDILIGALEASQQAFAIFGHNGEVIVENDLHKQVFGRSADSLERFDKPVQRGGLHWQKSVQRIQGVGTVVIYTDVSRIEEARSEIENARNEAEAASEAKTRFLGSMSAELKAPLDVISACAGVIGSSSNIPCTEAETREYADKIAEQALILSSTLDGIINFTRMEREDFLTQTSDVSVYDSINSIVRKLTEKTPSRSDRHVKVNVPKDLSAALDENSFEMIIRNILKNALESGSSEPVIIKAGKVSGAGLVIMIRDRGRGMTPEVLEQAYEPFFHSRPAHQKYGNSTGVGLGLSVAKRLADAQGVQIKLRSEQGKGTTAFITIPEGLVRQAMPVSTTDEDLLRLQAPEPEKKTG